MFWKRIFRSRRSPFFLNVVVTFWGIKNHEYDGTNALSTVACLSRCGLNMRGISIALASTHVQLSSGVKLMADEKQGASFRGSVVEETRLVERQAENTNETT